MMCKQLRSGSVSGKLCDSINLAVAFKKHYKTCQHHTATSVTFTNFTPTPPPRLRDTLCVFLLVCLPAASRTKRTPSTRVFFKDMASVGTYSFSPGLIITAPYYTEHGFCTFIVTLIPPPPPFPSLEMLTPTNAGKTIADLKTAEGTSI